MITIIASLLLVLFPVKPARAQTTVPAPESAQYQVDEHVSSLADAIYDAEGRCAAGQSGEYGCYQYLPTTWVAYSTDVAGKVLPQTPENERYVTEGMIRAWIAEGVSDRGILLTWNQGTPGPDCYKGVNDHGVPYDSCAYAIRGLAYMADHGVQKDATVR